MKKLLNKEYVLKTKFKWLIFEELISVALWMILFYLLLTIFNSSITAFLIYVSENDVANMFFLLCVPIFITCFIVGCVIKYIMYENGEEKVNNE